MIDNSNPDPRFPKTIFVCPLVCTLVDSFWLWMLPWPEFLSVQSSDQPLKFPNEILLVGFAVSARGLSLFTNTSAVARGVVVVCSSSNMFVAAAREAAASKANRWYFRLRHGSQCVDDDAAGVLL